MAKQTALDERNNVDKSIQLITAAIKATMLASRAASQGRGLKAPIQRKRRAIAALFLAMVGRKPSDEELATMIADTAGII
jgi:hypothetical protein